MGHREQLADFGAFYEHTYPAAPRVAFGIVGERAMADDVTQDAFATAYRQRDRYRGDGPPEAWLYRIVVNTALGALRHQRVRWIVPLDPDADERPAEGASSMESHAEMAEGLRQLDPRARSAVVLRYYLELDCARIGAIRRPVEERRQDHEGRVEDVEGSRDGDPRRRQGDRRRRVRRVVDRTPRSSMLM